jgi:hypothetical protein
MQHRCDLIGRRERRAAKARRYVQAQWHYVQHLKRAAAREERLLVAGRR